MTTGTAETPAATPQRTIYQLFAEVKRKVGPVGKDSHNKQQNFNYRGVDAVVNAVAAALDEYGVITIPILQEIEASTVEVGNNRSVMGHVAVKVTYRFAGPAGDHFDATVPGEAMDSGDKATAKAMSVAYRIALLQTLNLPTGDPDPDSQSYERSARSASQAAAETFGNPDPAPSRQQRNGSSRDDGPRPDPVAQALAKLALQIASNPDKTLADFSEQVEKRAAVKDKLNAPVANPFGDGMVKLRDVLREARRRMQPGQPEDGPSVGEQAEATAAASEADAETAGAAADQSDPEAAFVIAYMARVADATDDQLAGMRPEIGVAVKDKTITPKVAGELSAAVSVRRRELAEASA